MIQHNPHRYLVVHPQLAGCVLSLDQYDDACDVCDDLGLDFDLNSIGTMKSRATLIHTEASFEDELADFQENCQTSED